MFINPLRSLLQICLLIITCSSSSFSEERVRIGVLQSLTGFAAQYGKGLVQILELAADDINAASASRLELIVEDDLTESRAAALAFQNLVNVKKVDAVIGSTWDSATNAVIPLSAQYSTILFNVSVMPEVLNLPEGKGFAFTNAQSIHDEASPLAEFLRRHSVKSASIAYASNRWGEAMREAHRAVLLASRVSLLDEVKPTGIDANDWGNLLLRLRSKKPELMLLLLNQNDIDAFLKRARELKINSLFYTSNNSWDALQQANDKSLYEGVCFAYPSERLRRMEDVTRRYQARFHEPTRWYADNAYDALWILYRAILASRRNKTAAREELIKSDYEGLAGRYQFKQELSFSLGGLSLTCIQDGKTADML